MLEASEIEVLMRNHGVDKLDSEAAEAVRSLCKAVEVEVLKNGAATETLLRELKVKGGAIDLEVEGGAARIMAEMLAEQFRTAGAMNYVEMKFVSRHSVPGEGFVVTVQRSAGQTAHELRRSAEQKADGAKSLAKILGDLLDEVRTGFTRDDDLPNGLLPRIDEALAAVNG